MEKDLPGGSLPTAVASLIAEHIDSVLRLEAILMLHAQPDRLWTLSELVGELGVTSEWARAQLTYLENQGFLVRELDAFRYRPNATALGEAVAALSAEYARRRVTVVSAIYSRRPSALQSFAQAFRMRGNNPPGGSNG